MEERLHNLYFAKLRDSLLDLERCFGNCVIHYLALLCRLVVNLLLKLNILVLYLFQCLIDVAFFVFERILQSILVVSGILDLSVKVIGFLLVIGGQLLRQFNIEAQLDDLSLLFLQDSLVLFDQICLLLVNIELLHVQILQNLVAVLRDQLLTLMNDLLEDSLFLFGEKRLLEIIEFILCIKGIVNFQITRLKQSLKFSGRR